VSRLSRSLLVSIGVAVLPARALGADDYDVIYDGAPAALEEKLRKLTNLSLERRPYPTAAAVRRAGAEDLDIVRKALNAAGYYAATVAFRVDGETENGRKLKAIFSIEPGEPFRIVRHEIVYIDDGGPERPPTFEAAKIDVGDRADGATLEGNHQRFVAALWAAGYPAARMTARRADARLADGTADAVYSIESGPRARFAGVAIEGEVKTDRGFLEKLKTWEDGDIFDREKLVDYRDRLAKIGVFSSIEVSPGAVDATGAAPVQVKVVEREQRTFGAGVSYSTSEGPGGRLFLEYRNLLRHAERARAEIEASEVEQSISFDVERPLPGFPGSAYGNFAFANETTDAFKARSLALGAGLLKSWTDRKLETRAGLALETSKVEPNLALTSTIKEERTYYVSIPLSATWNTEKDVLRLDDGAMLSLYATPYFGSDQFTRIEATARSRVNFGAADAFTLAGRLRVAATAGQALRTLPVNKRVYSGGGSSVRGYDYQAVGPLDANGVPVGGRSAVEAAVEARAKIMTKVQVAAFVDAGAVQSASLPDFTGDYLVGAGLGVRYLTPIGPLRIDVATPLEKRPSDRDFQIYISLGQPF
jgi:translocation and assembly module TamA